MKKQNRTLNVKEHVLPDGSWSPELKEFLEDAAVEINKSAVDHKQPPWTAFPTYKRYSMGWKMGPGEDYWHAFHAWIRSLESHNAEAFISEHPEPKDWKGFYESIGIGS